MATFQAQRPAERLLTMQGPFIDKISTFLAFGTLNGSVTDLDTLPATIMLKKTKAVLSCAAGYLNVDMEFDKPFYGIVYADFDRNSACKITGDGATSSQIKLPLKGCGTLQVSTLHTKVYRYTRYFFIYICDDKFEN